MHGTHKTGIHSKTDMLKMPLCSSLVTQIGALTSLDFCLSLGIYIRDNMQCYRVKVTAQRVLDVKDPTIETSVI